MYIFTGVVLPERAQLSLAFPIHFAHIASGAQGAADVSIILNQIAVRVNSDFEWDVFDLRNLVKSILQNNLAIVGYLAGHAYELEISRVLNVERGIDLVFGIDIPCLSGRSNRSSNMEDAFANIASKVAGPDGVYLNRCFVDLTNAMRNADDTGFYCYRAIESLRHHCARRFGLGGASKGEQWAKLHEVSGIAEGKFLGLKAAADASRHGEPEVPTSNNRADLLVTTWEIVDAYLPTVPPVQFIASQ